MNVRWLLICACAVLLLTACQKGENADEKTEEEAPSEPENVVDYFNLMPVSEDYTLEELRSRYNVLNADGAKADSVSVEKGLGTIRFRDMTDDKFIRVVEIQVFKDAKGRDYVAYMNTVNEKESRAQKEELVFYTYADGKMTDATASVMELPDKKDFLSDGYTVSEQDSAAWNAITVAYFHSQKDDNLQDVTHMVASLNKEPACANVEGSSFEKLHPELCEAIAYKFINYEWNPEVGKFEFLAKKPVDSF